MTRRQLRENILRLLYLRDFHETEELEEQYGLYFELFTDNSSEDTAAVTERLNLIISELPEIDSIIAGALSGWKMNRIGKIELNLLRIATYEIKFDEEVPDRVAVNEAVELAKQYGSDDSSYGFVNGVLAKIIK